MTRPVIYRFFVIDNAIRRGKAVNCTTLSRRLEVSIRTIRRDLEYLRDMFAAPIVYDYLSRNYRYSHEFRLFAEGLPCPI